MLSAITATGWDFDAAAHLLVRAGFGGDPSEIQKTLALGPEKAVDSMVNAPPESYPPPTWATPNDGSELRAQVQEAATPADKEAAIRLLQQKFIAEMKDLTRWWVIRMVNTPSPLLEKMTLFWHGHFATSGQKVRPAYKMWRQNETFRQNALGNFSSLVKAVSRDPAMMIWLDIVQSKKESPNENFGREVMELFTLGEGHYTESDVKAAAQAFTGYRINQQEQSFRFAEGQFDPGLKSFLGRTGPWDGDQILDIIVSQPQCARFIGAKIWKFFAYDDAHPKLLDAIASEFRNAHYELRPLMKTLFLSEEFYSSRARNSQIKCPVQLIVQALRTMPVALPDSDLFAFAFRQMGQVPFFPPNVKGWDGGKSWINTATLAFRYKLLRQLVEGVNPQEIGLPKPVALDMSSPGPTTTTPVVVGKLVSEEDRTRPEVLIQKLSVRTFQRTPQRELTGMFRDFLATRELPLDDHAIRDLLLLMMTTPNYQVT
ncbi:MAG: DUF1800 domain-containing protein [Verrucomicrobia bacterium]|nr:DUF1800 domain-containing protein [Verrucomicrobiota bacterium]